jgi:hypothetical protein
VLLVCVQIDLSDDYLLLTLFADGEWEGQTQPIQLGDDGGLEPLKVDEQQFKDFVGMIKTLQVRGEQQRATRAGAVRACEWIRIACYKLHLGAPNGRDSWVLRIVLCCPFKASCCAANFPLWLPGSLSPYPGCAVVLKLAGVLCSAVQEMEEEMMQQQGQQQATGPIDVTAEPVNGR